MLNDTHQLPAEVRVAAPDCKTLLLVEDESIVRLNETQMLAKRGYDVIGVSSGQEAIEKVRTNPGISLILMDINLGRGMDGTEAARAILADHDIPLVFLSDHTDPEVVAKTEEITSYGYVVKGSGIAVLDTSIKMAFRLHSAHREILAKERILRDTELKASALIDAVEESVGLFALDGTFLTVNRTGASRAGMSADQLVGKKNFPDVSPLQLESRRKTIARVGATGVPITIEDERDGVVLEHSFYPVRNSSGAIVSVASFGRDISERRRIQDALITRQTEMSDAMELAGLVHWRRDPANGDFIFNDPFYAFYATTAEREGGYRMGGEEFEKRFVHPDDIAMVRAFIERNRTNMNPELVTHLEHRVIRRDGQVRNILVRTRVFRDIDGHIVRVSGADQDITERIRAEEALRESEAKFRSFVEESPLAIFVADLEGRIVEVNRAVTELLGYDVASLLGMTVWELYPPGDRETGRRDFAAFSREGRVEAEHRFQRKDGSTIWVSLHATMIGDRYSLAYCSDITDRRNAKETLKRYQLLSENIPDIILFMERDTGKILEANLAAHYAYGCSREELLSLNVRDLQASEELGPISAQMEEADRRGVLFETIHRRKDGSTFPVEVSSRGETINGIHTVISIVRDITERRRHEEQIEMLKHSIDLHYDAAYWLDQDSQFIYVNNTACSTLGYSRGELIGKPFSEIAPRVTPEMLRAFWQKLRTEEFVLMESVHRRTDGTEFPIEIAATYVEFAGKAFACIFARDLTEKRRLEDQLRHAQKMEAVGTLAGGVAHDFNNLLTVILGFAELIQVSTEHEGEIRPYADEIVKSSNRAADLTRSLLAFSRKQRIDSEPRRINEIVKDTAKLLKRLLPEDIRLTLDLSKNDPIARVDVTQIDQVIMNLVTNARDAMPKGGKLTIATQWARIDAQFVRAHGFGILGDYVKLSVTDAGIGMDKKTLEHIFEPFFTTKDVGKGTGLGLASAFGIVTQHNGYITVSSTPRVGTTFDIYLPLLKEAPPRGASPETTIRGGAETILVVEDDRGVRNMVTMILHDRGYTVLEAVDGEDALRMYSRHKEQIDLIILDVVMPGRNGKEVLDEIAATNPKIKVIFVSGYTGDVVIDKGIQQESVNFLQKPLSVTMLLAKVREVLDR